MGIIKTYSTHDSALETLKGWDTPVIESPRRSINDKPDYIDIAHRMHSSKLEAVESDFENDLRVGLKTILKDIDWILDYEREGLGSFHYACTLEGRDPEEESKRILFIFVKSPHFQKLKEALPRYAFKQFQLDMASRIN